MENNHAPKQKKFFMPFFLSALGAFSMFMLVVSYGPRKRSLIDTMLRPREPFESLNYDGLTDFGKTLAIAVAIVSFLLIFYLVYNYVNKPKMKKNEDIE